MKGGKRDRKEAGERNEGEEGDEENEWEKDEGEEQLRLRFQLRLQCALTLYTGKCAPLLL